MSGSPRPKRGSKRPRARFARPGVSPNPSIGVEVENFPRSNFNTPFDRTEATLYYQRTVERGDKREARTDVSRADLEVVRLRRIVRGLDLFQSVETAWNEAVAAEAAVQIAEQRFTVSGVPGARCDAGSKPRAIRCLPAPAWTRR